MVPLTEVAFMPGTIAGGSVMVGLGQDYFVERTPKEAQAVLQRRIAGARVLACVYRIRDLEARRQVDSQSKGRDVQRRK